MIWIFLQRHCCWIYGEMPLTFRISENKRRKIYINIQLKNIQIQWINTKKCKKFSWWTGLKISPKMVIMQYSYIKYTGSSVCISSLHGNKRQRWWHPLLAKLNQYKLSLCCSSKPPLNISNLYLLYTASTNWDVVDAVFPHRSKMYTYMHTC